MSNVKQMEQYFCSPRSCMDLMLLPRDQSSRPYFHEVYSDEKVGRKHLLPLQNALASLVDLNLRSYSLLDSLHIPLATLVKHEPWKARMNRGLGSGCKVLFLSLGLIVIKVVGCDPQIDSSYIDGTALLRA